MGIQKQEFYEGAALHQIVRNGRGALFKHVAPVFILDDRIQLHLKYSTKNRSPWGFTFTADEQLVLHELAGEMALVMGLICGSDGIATVRFEDYSKIAAIRNTSIRVSCFRKHREHFEVCGPDGTISRKIPPSDWQRV